MRLILAFLVFGLVDAGYHRHEIRQPVAEMSGGQQQTLMGKAFCPIVQRARASGMSDEQIIASALLKGVPQSIVLWAQKNCTSASGVHGNGKS